MGFDAIPNTSVPRYIITLASVPSTFPLVKKLEKLVLQILNMWIAPMPTITLRKSKRQRSGMVVSAVETIYWDEHLRRRCGV